MEKVIAPNRRTGRMMAKNLIILLTVAIVAFIGIWAWFTNHSTATADGINVKCQAPDGVEIAVVEHGADEPADDQYSTTVSLDSTGFLAKLIMTELTSDGTTFIKPNLTQQDGIASPNTSTDSKNDWANNTVTPGQDYLCFDLYMRTRTKKNIYLDGSSSVSPNSSTLTWTGGDGSAYNPSTYGNFSKDCIAGATRVSILNAKETSQRLLWLPRPDIMLIQNNNEYSVQTGITDTTSKSYVHSYWNLNKQLIENGNAIASTVNAGEVTLAAKTRITSFDIDEDSDVHQKGDYYYTHVVFNTWIEGTDDEARLALSGGQFSINLNLSADTTN